MRDFDVYDFLPVNIADYYRKNNKVFSQLEMVAIIDNSEKTVPHKHKAYNAIIENHSDITIPPVEGVPPFPGIPSLHETLKAIINYEENAISEFSAPGESIVYLPQLMADTDIPYQYTPINPSAIFTTIDKTISAFDDLAGFLKESVRNICVEKIDLSRTDSAYQMDSCLYFSFDGEVLFVPYLFDGGYDDDDGESRFYPAYFKYIYNRIELQIPPIILLTDTSVKDAIFALLTEIYRKDFEADAEVFIHRFDNNPESFDIDFNRITELELIMPESLDDLIWFPNLERLIICRPPDCKHSNALNAGILVCPAVDNLCITDLGGKLKEVIIKRDLG